MYVHNCWVNALHSTRVFLFHYSLIRPSCSLITNKKETGRICICNKSIASKWKNYLLTFYYIHTYICMYEYTYNISFNSKWGYRFWWKLYSNKNLQINEFQRDHIYQTPEFAHNEVTFLASIRIIFSPPL